MKGANRLPRFLLPALSRLAARAAGEEEIESVTGLSRERWRELADFFPAIGPDPGPEAARARRRLEFLLGRALGTDRHAPRWRGAAPGTVPTLYVTAHIGDVRSQRYFLRRFFPAGTVIATTEARERAAAEDALFDRRVPRDFPHVHASNRPHRLRSTLREGSLIAAADVPPTHGVNAPLLGGTVRLDPRPFRLALLARVPCRALFLTAPCRRLTVTLGDPLPREGAAALAEFARQLARVAEESPWEIDGATRWGELHRP